ncbi:MAG: type II toxin-antitoxin system HipA family toxin, partial [Bacteroidia bacterium]|nr:type II toxin-antitoxin system HipA family toxin [Bacteroidia bacterium]
DDLSLTIDETSGVLDFDLAMNVATYFRLNKKEAGTILSAVKKTVSNWVKVARQTGISRNEIEMMRSAFRY